MALQASTVWEIRTAGNNNNGGGYTSGGTDYSQQDNAQQSWTNLSISGSTLTDDDSGGNFTAAMVGNIINVLTVGRFEIIAYVNGNNVTLDRAPGDGSGYTGYVGGAVADLEQIDSVIVAGNTIHMKSGTYNAAATITLTSGTAAAVVTLEGYNTSRGDDPTGTNRPLYQMSTYTMSIGNYTVLKNLRLTGSSATALLDLNTYNFVVNCLFNSSGNGDSVEMAGGCVLVDCEIRNSGGSGRGVDATAKGCRMHGCFIEATNIGVELDYDSCTILFCIFDSCAQGLVLSGTNARSQQFVVNNVFYNCDDGVYCSLSIYSCLIINNIFSDGVDGIHIGASSPSNRIDYNNFYNNSGNDVTNVSKGSNTTSNDPQFTNAGAENFSLQSGSACIGAGFATRLGVS